MILRVVPLAKLKNINCSNIMIISEIQEDTTALGFIFCNYPRPRFSPALPYNLAHKEAKKSVISSEAQSTESRYDKLFSLK